MQTSLCRSLRGGCEIQANTSQTSVTTIVNNGTICTANAAEKQPFLPELRVIFGPPPILLKHSPDGLCPALYLFNFRSLAEPNTRDMK